MTGKRRRYLTEWQAIALAGLAFILIFLVAVAMLISRWFG